jgi:predicted O-methyltransferase YrrM
MNFDTVADATRGIPVMGEREGRKLYDYVRASRPDHVLEIGTAHGVSACYIAAALEENGHGQLSTVDHRNAGYAAPSADELFTTTGLGDWIDRLLIEDSSYTWWLKGQLERRTDDAGNTAPLYDFCFLDGAHNWTIDGLAVILIERLLRPGAWLLLDDVDWTYAGYEEDISITPPSDKMFTMSEDELHTPQVGAVVEVIIKSHPSFSEVRIQDDRWAWCRKDISPSRLMTVETSRPLSVLVSLAAERGVRRGRAALRRLRS